MKIELSSSQIDEVTKKTIAALEKQVKALERKLYQRDKSISQLKDKNKFSKEMRDIVLMDAASLVEALEDAGWIDYDRYGERS